MSQTAGRTGIPRKIIRYLDISVTNDGTDVTAGPVTTPPLGMVYLVSSQIKVTAQAWYSDPFSGDEGPLPGIEVVGAGEFWLESLPPQPDTGTFQIPVSTTGVAWTTDARQPAFGLWELSFKCRILGVRHDQSIKLLKSYTLH